MVSRVEIPAIAIAFACATPVSGPSTSTGRVLFLDDDVLVVQHDTTRGRVVPGVEHYPRHGLPLDGVDPGEDVDLWLVDHQLTTVAVVGGAPSTPVTHAVRGTVVRIEGSIATVDHDEIPGIMPAMVMNMRVGDSHAHEIHPGDHLTGRLLASDYGWQLLKVQSTTTSSQPPPSDRPLKIGEPLPPVTVPTPNGPIVLGGPGLPTALAYVYTTCPDPTYCPATVSRLQQLQAKITERSRIVTITIDPEHDTLPVLSRYADQVGSHQDRWRWGRLEPVPLQHLALQSGLAVSFESGRIAHDLRLLVLDHRGVLVARHDDNEWSVEEVADLLNAGVGPP